MAHYAHVLGYQYAVLTNDPDVQYGVVILVILFCVERD